MSTHVFFLILLSLFGQRGFSRFDTRTYTILQTTDSINFRNDSYCFSMIRAFQTEQKWDSVLSYAYLIQDKSAAAVKLNSLALLLGSNYYNMADSSRLSLETRFARASLYMSDQSAKQKKCLLDDSITFQNDQCKDIWLLNKLCHDTYASILYKTGKFDSAFYHVAIANSGEIYIPVILHYISIAKKAKGSAFIRSYLEKKYISGIAQDTLLAILKEVYDELQLSASALSNVMDMATDHIRNKLQDSVFSKAVSYKAPDFNLGDLKNKRVTRENYKGKIIVLDFWATWCDPCIRSFEPMQTLISEYKDNKDIVFLFVDTKENFANQKNLEVVSSFVKKRNLPFNVLLDINNKMADDYGIDRLPVKLVIDQKGYVKYKSIGFDGDNRKLIEELKMMIENLRQHVSY